MQNVEGSLYGGTWEEIVVDHEKRLRDLEAKLALAVEALKEIEDGWTAAADDDTGELVAVRVSDDEMVKIARAALAQINTQWKGKDK